MSYGRDYGNRNFLDRAANTVRGWFGDRGGHDYDRGYRAGTRGGWDEGHGGYRETGDVSGGYRNWQGGMEHGYGATNWTGRNPDWDRGDAGGGWGRGTGEGYRTGGYQPQHGGWDVDWDDDDRTLPGGSMRRGGTSGGMSGGMMGSGGPRYDRGYQEGRAFMSNAPAYDRHDTFRDEPGMRGGSTGRGMTGEVYRGYDRDMGADRNRSGGGMRYDSGMRYDNGMRGDAGMGGGVLGSYGAANNYGMGRFRNLGAPSTGRFWTGYGDGNGYSS